jgi:predicted nucleic acid-binding Zn ribbon protein
VIDALGLTQRLEGQRAIALWPEVAGKGVAAHAEAKEFRDGRLVVAVDGSVWIQELSLRRRELVDSLNARLADRASPAERRARGVVRELLFVAREPRTRQG